MELPSIGVSDDYAVLDAGGYHFYYGYEQTNEDDEWLFVVKKEGYVLHKFPLEEQRKKYPGEPYLVLLYGIGLWITMREEEE